MKKTALIIAILFSVNNIFAQAHTKQKLEIVAELNFRPGNVAVSKTGRVFSTVHPLGGGDLQVIEITNKKNTIRIRQRVTRKMASLQVMAHLTHLLE